MGIMGKESGNYYIILVLYWDNGKTNGNYDLWFEGGVGALEVWGFKGFRVQWVKGLGVFRVFRVECLGG